MKFFNQKQLAICLLVLTAIPFPVLALMKLSGQSASTVDPVLMLHVYTGVLTAFTAGMQWSIHFCKRTADSVYLFSVFILVLILYSLFSAGEKSGLALALPGVVMTWIIELRLSRQRVTTAWFWHGRCIVSFAAVASILLVLVV